MKNIILVFLTLVFTFSSCIMEEPKTFSNIDYPEPCFQNGGTFDKCVDYSAPIPSDYMSAVLPAGIPISLSFPSSYPLNIRLSSPVDISTLKDGLHVLKTDGIVHEVVDNTKYVIQLGELDTSTFQFSDDKTFLNILPVNDDMTPRAWDEGFTYLVVLSKELKDINGLEYAKPAAFFMASSTFEITTDIVKALDPGMSDEEALATVQVLLAMREALNEPYQLIEFLLNKTKFDVSFLWTFKFNRSTVCFNSTDIEGCENSSLAPIPSDFVMKYEDDGSHHLDLPISDDSPDMLKGLLTALNSLDGWSTVKPFNITFSDALDVETLTPTNLLVLKIAENDIAINPIPIAVIPSFREDWNQLDIKPLIRNWDEKSRYLVVLTDGIKTKTGKDFLQPLSFFFMAQEESLLTNDSDGNLISKYSDLLSLENAKQLEGGRLLLKPALDNLSTMGYERNNILMMWTVTTQSVTDEIKSMRGFVLANPGFTDSMVLSDAQTIPNAAFPGVFPDIELSNVSVIAFGTFKAPMFLSESTSPYMGAFNPNKFPADESTPPTENAELLDIPFLVAFPTPADENIVANNKVIIFQHGFSRQKEDVLPLLNSFTAQGYIVVSYDMPFHGARTLDGANTGDGFISLNVFASRDNIRQAVLEQVKLIKTLKGIDFSAIDTTNQIKYSTIDSDNIYYVGHSMGTFVGNILVSIEDSIKAGALNAAGANFTKMLMSTTEDIKSPLTDGLAALGIVEGTPEFDQFLYLAQVGVEKADSINYKSATDNILIQEAVGDPVIINEVTRDFGISQGFVNPMDNSIIKPSNYISYSTNASIEDIHSFLLLDTSATDDARSDVLNFFLNAQ